MIIYIFYLRPETKCKNGQAIVHPGPENKKRYPFMEANNIILTDDVNRSELYMIDFSTYSDCCAEAEQKSSVPEYPSEMCPRYEGSRHCQTASAVVGFTGQSQGWP